VQSTRRLTLGSLSLPCELAMSGDAKALVLIVHPDTASRCHPGQRFIADVLHANQLATLSFSLRTPDEERSRAPAADLAEQGERICCVLDALWQRKALSRLHFGLLGVADAVPGCIAAAARTDAGTLFSLVLLDGRPDLAIGELAGLHLPTLLVAGASDPQAVASHWAAAQVMKGTHRLEVLPHSLRDGAAPGGHEAAACVATAWVGQALPLLAERSPLDGPLPMATGAGRVRGAAASGHEARRCGTRTITASQPLPPRS
jgi:putative phosphoribosyl transferase